MDYSLPERADRLAADYVLGTLRGAARRRFEHLLPAHPVLRQAVARWQEVLTPLAASVPPVQPAAHVWLRIEERLFERPAGLNPSRPAQAARPPVGQPLRRLGLIALTLLVLGLLAVAVLRLAPRADASPVVVVLSQSSGPPSFVISVAGDGRSLVLAPLGGVTVDAQHELELWQLGEQNMVRSLGLVSAHRPSQVQRRHLLDETVGFALSLELRGGSATGSPSGPIVSTGRIRP
ncbi:MAG: hypothetical protein RL722_1893 [Pseudomonadota bacterium]|jgi:anti-sigma-K factor RskA